MSKAARAFAPRVRLAIRSGDCRKQGSACRKHLVYPCRYLYRGVVREKDLLSCDDQRGSFTTNRGKSRWLEKKLAAFKHR